MQRGPRARGSTVADEFGVKMYLRIQLAGACSVESYNVDLHLLLLLRLAS